MENIIVSAPAPGGGLIDNPYTDAGHTTGDFATAIANAAALAANQKIQAYLASPEFFAEMQRIQDKIDEEKEIEETQPEDSAPGEPQDDPPVEEPVEEISDEDKVAAVIAAGAIPLTPGAVTVIEEVIVKGSRLTRTDVLNLAKFTATRANFYVALAILAVELTPELVSWYNQYVASLEPVTPVEPITGLPVDSTSRYPGGTESGYKPGASPTFRAGASSGGWRRRWEANYQHVMQTEWKWNPDYVKPVEEIIVRAPLVRPGYVEYYIDYESMYTPRIVNPTFAIPRDMVTALPDWATLGFPIAPPLEGTPARPMEPAIDASTDLPMAPPLEGTPALPGVQEPPTAVPLPIPGQIPLVPDIGVIPEAPTWNASITIAQTINGLLLQIRTNDIARTKAQARARAREARKQRKDRKHKKSAEAYRLVLRTISQTFGRATEMLDFANVLMQNTYVVNVKGYGLTGVTKTPVSQLPKAAAIQLFKDLKDGKVDIRDLEFDMDQALVDFAANQAMDMAIGRMASIHGSALQDMGLVSGIRSNPINYF